MKLMIESTQHVVELGLSESELGGTKARLWFGVTESGVPVTVFVVGIAVDTDAPEEVHQRFAQELEEVAPPERIRVLDDGHLEG